MLAAATSAEDCPMTEMTPITRRALLLIMTGIATDSGSQHAAAESAQTRASNHAI
jgi:nanoRNase/pAp phosphatase (c-di-AMP/oligoRNAs hydrolase)